MRNERRESCHPCTGLSSGIISRGTNLVVNEWNTEEQCSRVIVLLRLDTQYCVLHIADVDIPAKMTRISFDEFWYDTAILLLTFLI